jgi:hypothetical protein
MQAEHGVIGVLLTQSPPTRNVREVADMAGVYTQEDSIAGG